MFKIYEQFALVKYLLMRRNLCPDKTFEHFLNSGAVTKVVNILSVRHLKQEQKNFNIF